MIHQEDIYAELVRLYGDNAAMEFDIISIGPAFLVGRNLFDAVEISGWENFDLLSTF